MANKNLILINPILSQYQVSIDLVKDLESTGRIAIVEESESYFLPQEQLGDLERMIRLSNELHINPEGIDAIFYLLERLDLMQSRLNILRERLGLLDHEFED